MVRRSMLVLAVLALTLTTVAPAGARGAARLRAAVASGSGEGSCRAFVQRFYDWYLRLSEKEKKLSPSDLALRSHASWFSRELKRRLAEDSTAAAKSPGEIVGLDFDPFLNAQDTPQRCVVKRVTSKGGSYRAEVHRVESGKTVQDPAVVPELIQRGGQWTFVNFHYPSTDGPRHEDDLLNVLKRLREDRKKPHP